MNYRGAFHGNLNLIILLRSNIIMVNLCMGDIITLMYRADNAYNVQTLQHYYRRKTNASLHNNQKKLRRQNNVYYSKSVKK